jgi:hypothetical protein
MMRQYGMDSLWLAVAFGLGTGLGYIFVWVQFEEFRQEAADRMFYRNGKWVEPAEYAEVTWGRAPSGDSEGSATEDGSDIISGEL